MSPWSFLIITKSSNKTKILQILFYCFLSSLHACKSSPKAAEPSEEDILEGTIADPFAPVKPIGINAQKEKFVIKSIIGQTEYAVEIPGAGDDYDIEIPLADINGKDSPNGKNRFLDKPTSNPVSTDQELTSHFPKPIKNESQTQALDQAFGVVPQEGITQSPSYIMGLSKISQLYKQKQFELALVEINNLLESYPTSPRLYKMKGTVLVKLGDVPLAQVAWHKALELNPKDMVLKQSLEKLK